MRGPRRSPGPGAPGKWTGMRASRLTRSLQRRAARQVMAWRCCVPTLIGVPRALVLHVRSPSEDHPLVGDLPAVPGAYISPDEPEKGREPGRLGADKGYSATEIDPQAHGSKDRFATHFVPFRSVRGRR